MAFSDLYQTRVPPSCPHPNTFSLIAPNKKASRILWSLLSQQQRWKASSLWAIGFEATVDGESPHSLVQISSVGNMEWMELSPQLWTFPREPVYMSCGFYNGPHGSPWPPGTSWTESGNTEWHFVCKEIPIHRKIQMAGRGGLKLSDYRDLSLCFLLSGKNALETGPDISRRGGGRHSVCKGPPEGLWLSPLGSQLISHLPWWCKTDLLCALLWGRICSQE